MEDESKVLDKPACSEHGSDEESPVMEVMDFCINENYILPTKIIETIGFSHVS